MPILITTNIDDLVALNLILYYNKLIFCSIEGDFKVVFG